MKNIEEKKLWKCPRVGLTLKKYDEYKEKFWMADYRYLVFPEKNKKFSCFTILSMIKAGMSVYQILKEAKVKQSTVDDLLSNYN